MYLVVSKIASNGTDSSKCFRRSLRSGKTNLTAIVAIPDLSID